MKRSIYLLSSTPIQGAIHLPLLTIEWTDIHIDFSLYDALIFTSKNGVRAMKYQSSEWKRKACYAIAPKTAQLLQEKGVTPITVGHFNNGDVFARELTYHLTQQRALYVRAQKTVSDLTFILRQGGVAVDEAIVYRTGCHKLKPLPRLNDNAIIIFASPSTIECFFNQYDWHFSYDAICIGETTAHHLPSSIKPHIASTTSLESCLAMANEMAKI